MNFINVQDPNTARNKKAVRAHAARKGYEARRAKQTAELVPKRATVLPVHVESAQADPHPSSRTLHEWANEHHPTDAQRGRIEKRYRQPHGQRAPSNVTYGDVGASYARPQHHIHSERGPSGCLGDQYIPPRENFHNVREKYIQSTSQHSQHLEEGLVKNVNHEFIGGARRGRDVDIPLSVGDEPTPPP